MPTTVTNVIAPSGGDYTTITAWEAAVQADLVAADEIQVASCETFSGGLSDTITIDGWTVDATRYVVIEAAAAHRHDGTPGSAFYLAKTENFGTLLDSNIAFTNLHYLDIQNTSTNANSVGASFSNLNGTAIGCLFTGGGGGLQQIGSSNDIGSDIRACVAYGAVDGFRISNSNNNPTAFPNLDNCTAANCSANGFEKGGSEGANLTNCVGFGNGIDFTLLAGDWGSSSFNASSDSTEPGTSPFLTDIVSGDFVDEANDDYHLASGSNLIGEGLDLSGTFTLDFEGDTFGATWDIGADFRVSADVIDPILTSPATTNATATTIDGTVSTDENNLTLYGIISASAVAAPSVVQIQAGNDGAGASAVWSDNQPVIGTGIQTLSASETIVPGVAYKFHFQQIDTAGNDSTVVSSAEFTLSALAGTATYDGLAIPNDSILHYAEGTHTGANNAAALTTALTLTLDEYIDLRLLNKTDVSETIVTGNTAGSNSVISGILAGGPDSDWDSGDSYQVEADIDSSDIIRHSATGNVVSELVTMSWYIEDVSAGTYSAVYTQGVSVPGEPDGAVTITVSVKGVPTFIYTTSGGTVVVLSGPPTMDLVSSITRDLVS